MKILALLPVKNEEWCLRHCLDSLSFADEILAIDDGSTDATPNILRSYGCTIIPFDSQTDLGWKEHAIRTTLLEKARKRGATHIIALDGDESCSPEFTRNAREILSSLTPGQALEMEWLNLCSHKTYKEPRVFKSFAFCDDGTSTHQKAFLGVGRVPQTEVAPIRPEGSNLIYHFQYVDLTRCAYKQAWYMMSELLKAQRSARRINATYVHTKRIDCIPLPHPVAPELLPRISDSAPIWQRDEILRMFSVHGIRKFEPLDIWHIPHLSELFKKETGRLPNPMVFPSWILRLNDVKNKVKMIYYKMIKRLK